MASRQRRPRGDGAVYYDESRDRWVGQIDLGIDALGKRIRPKVVGATPSEVRKRLKELQANNENGQDVTQRTTTFAELTAAWFQRGLSADLSDNTRENYSRLLDQHVLPALGSQRVVSLRPDDIEKVLDHLHEANYAGSTIRHALGLTRRILRFGERRGTVIRNVASCVEAPRGPVAERHGLTPSQARSLLAAAKNDRIGGLITISLLLGLRPGEAAGLTWSAVELDGETPTLKVQASLRRTPSGMVLVAPKTPTSRRTLALPGAAVDALRAQKDRQRVDREMSGDQWANDLDLVFTTEVGTPLDPSNVRRSVSNVAKSAGLGHIHPHLLRHAAASLLSAAGVPLEDVSDILGEGDSADRHGAISSHGDTRGQVVLLRHRRTDHARADRVAADPTRSPLERELLG